MKNNLIDKEKWILNLIVESFIEDGESIGSSTLMKKYVIPFSSATIRNIMKSLEDKGYIEKSHSSSGRKPTNKGLKYYAKELFNQDKKEILERIKNIFIERKNNIDQTIEEAVRIISETYGITMITDDFSDSEEILKDISITRLTKDQSMIIIITSSGRIFNKIIYLNSRIKMEDLKIAIRIIRERLIDSLLVEIKERLEIIAPLLKSRIKNCDELIQIFIENLVLTNEEKSRKNVYGKNNIIQSENFSRDKLIEVIDFIEKKSIWESMEEFVSEEEQIKISITDENVSYVSKRLKLENKTKDISFIGTNRLDLSTIKNILNTIDELIKKE